MDKRTICFLISSLLTSALYGETLEHVSLAALTLDQTVQIALEKNLDIGLAEKELQAIQSQYRQALGAAVPDIHLSGGYTRNLKKPSFFIGGNSIEIGAKNSANGTVSVEQVIYSGGRVKTGIDIAHTLIGAQKENIRQARNDVIMQAKRLFYILLFSDAVVSIQRDRFELTKEHRETIRSRYRQGLESDLVVQRQEVEVANSKTAYIQAQNGYELAKLTLQDLLSLDSETPIAVEGKFNPPYKELPPYPLLLENAKKLRPELLQARKRTEVSKYLIRIAIGEQRPQMGAYLNYQWNAQSDDFNLTENERVQSAAAGINLRFALFTGGELYEQVKVYRIRYDQARLAEEKIERGVRLEVRRQWLSVGEARERIEAQSMAIDQAKLALRATEKRFAAGEASQLELNDASLAYHQTRTFYMQALHDYWGSIAALERAVGKPLEKVAGEEGG